VPLRGKERLRHEAVTLRRARRRYGRGMEAARAVIERLERIDALERQGAAAPLLLAEVRALLREGEAWLAAEGEDEGAEAAAAALERCRLAVEAGVAPVA
jgi:hypothetical protein